MYRAHKIRIYPNNAQETLLLKHCGCARLAYNVCLAKWEADYKEGISHNCYSMKRWFNSIKKEHYPFVYEVSKWACENAIADLDSAYKRFFKNLCEHPKFHKKGTHDSFRIEAQGVKIEDKILCLPKGLKLRLAEPLRYTPEKIINVIISRHADKWFASIQCEISDSKNQAEGKIGVHQGVTSLATLSNGNVYKNPRIYERYESRIITAQRSLSRKKRGSNNYKKAQAILAKLHYKVKCARLDNLHKVTSDICGKYSTVCLKEMNVKDMQATSYLAKSLSDVSFYEFRNMCEYKANEVLYVDKIQPTSKTCCICGKTHNMPLEVRKLVCDCGNNIRRELNSASNIIQWAKPKAPERKKSAVPREPNRIAA